MKYKCISDRTVVWDRVYGRRGRVSVFNLYLFLKIFLRPSHSTTSHTPHKNCLFGLNVVVFLGSWQITSLRALHLLSGCVSLIEHGELQRPQNVNDSCLGVRQKGFFFFAQTSSPARPPSHRGTLVPRAASSTKVQLAALALPSNGLSRGWGEGFRS